jgi:hypothetical protein
LYYSIVQPIRINGRIPYLLTENLHYVTTRFLLSIFFSHKSIESCWNGKTFFVLSLHSRPHLGSAISMDARVTYTSSNVWIYERLVLKHFLVVTVFSLMIYKLLYLMRHKERIIWPLHSTTDRVKDGCSIVTVVFEYKTCKWVKFYFLCVTDFGKVWKMSLLFLDIRQHTLVFVYRRFGTDSIKQLQ